MCINRGVLRGWFTARGQQRGGLRSPERRAGPADGRGREHGVVGFGEPQPVDFVLGCRRAGGSTRAVCGG